MIKAPRIWIGALSVSLFLVVWELATPMGWITAGDISQPSAVGKALVALLSSGEMTRHLLSSLKVLSVGFALAVVGGVTIGTLLARSEKLMMTFDPLLTAFYTTPRLALLPMLMVWFGVGEGATTAVIFLGAIFPVLINTITGINGVDPALIKAVRSFGGSEWDVSVKVLLPGALPTVFTGIRLGIGRALLSMIVGEMYASPVGLGSQIVLYGNAFRIAEMMALVAIVSVFGFLAVAFMRRLESALPGGHAEVKP